MPNQTEPNANNALGDLLRSMLPGCQVRSENTQTFPNHLGRHADVLIAIRAGIEGTNSELKRAHGLGRLRVRGGRRVRLAVYLKALACNFKRMVHARLVEMENTAQRAVGTIPAVAAA